MRMWMIDPKIMCRKHLMGEHLECHMFLGSIRNNKKLDGFVEKNCLEFKNLKKRHDEIITEMQLRGYTHKSPLKFDQKKYLNKYPPKIINSIVDKEKSIKDLLSRCHECFFRCEKIMNG